MTGILLFSVNSVLKTLLRAFSPFHQEIVHEAIIYFFVISAA